MIYADDQYVNQSTIKKSFQDFGLSDVFATANDGQDVVELIEKHLI